VEDEPQRQYQLDRHIGVDRLAARRGAARGLPAGKGRLVEPERQVTASPQPGLVGRPVRHPPALLRDAVTAGSIVLERHASDVAGLLGSGYLAASMHQRHGESDRMASRQPYAALPRTKPGTHLTRP